MRTRKARIIFLFVAITLLLPWSTACTNDADDGVVGYVADVSPIVPNDEHFDKQWALTKIQASPVWYLIVGW